MPSLVLTYNVSCTTGLSGDVATQTDDKENGCVDRKSTAGQLVHQRSGCFD
jgi:hypothetical protein